MPTFVKALQCPNDSQRTPVSCSALYFLFKSPEPRESSLAAIHLFSGCSCDEAQNGPSVLFTVFMLYDGRGAPVESAQMRDHDCLWS